MARYLANKQTREIHDLINATDACQINEIKGEHRLMVDDEDEVFHLIMEEGFNGCSYCLSEYNTDTIDPDWDDSPWLHL